MAEYTDQERDTIRGAAFGAMALVSKAEPGFFDMFSESAAGSKALAAAPKELQDILRSGGFVKPPEGGPDNLEPAVLAGLQQAKQILASKDPAAADSFRSVITTACDSVAQAKDGVAASEQAVIDKIKAALA